MDHRSADLSVEESLRRSSPTSSMTGETAQWSEPGYGSLKHSPSCERPCEWKIMANGWFQSATQIAREFDVQRIS